MTQSQTSLFLCRSKKTLNLSLRVRSTVTAMKESPITPTISIQGSLIGWCGCYLRQMAKVEAFPVKRIQISEPILNWKLYKLPFKLLRSSSASGQVNALKPINFSFCFKVTKKVVVPFFPINLYYAPKNSMPLRNLKPGKLALSHKWTITLKILPSGI